MPNKTLTQVPVTASDFQWVTLRQNADSGDLEAVGRYRVKTDSGIPIGPAREVVLPLTGAARTAAINFITDRMTPAANTQEGT